MSDIPSVYTYIIHEINVCMKICEMIYSVTRRLLPVLVQILEQEYWRTQDGVFESSRLRSTKATVPIESIPTPTLQNGNEAYPYTPEVTNENKSDATL
jgi:hypothetical protein